MTTFVDGQMIVQRDYQWVSADGGAADRAHVLLNLAVGGHSGTLIADKTGIDDSRFPQSLEVDYVRVYQKTMDHGMSQIGKDFCPTDGGC